MKFQQSISVFFPAYNDEYTIRKMVTNALDVLRTLTDDYEIIIVDDCSLDNTGKIADELAKEFYQVKVIHHKKNRGYGGALRSGFVAASKDWIFYTDGDAQFDVKEITILIEKADDADIVTGYRLKRSDPLSRRMFGGMYNWLVRTMFNLKVRDVDCDFRLIRRSVFDKVKLTKNSGVICVELMKKISQYNFKIHEVCVNHFNRRFGNSQFFKIKNIFYLGIDLTRLWVELIVLGRGIK